MFILNRNSMGGYTPGGPDKVLTQVNIGGCWCGQSYFHHRIVSSGGSNVILWRVRPRPASACRMKDPPQALAVRRIPDSLPACPRTGTIIRSFGAFRGWTIPARRTFPCSPLRRAIEQQYAGHVVPSPGGHLAEYRRKFQPRARSRERQSLRGQSQATQYFRNALSGGGCHEENSDFHARAGGCSQRELFGDATGRSQENPEKREPSGIGVKESPTRDIYGKIQSFKGTPVPSDPDGATIMQVDAKPAMDAQRSVPLVVGRAIAVKGTVDKAGVLHADILQRAKDSSVLWPADR